MSVVYFGNREIHELTYEELVAFYQKITAHDLFSIKQIIDEFLHENQAKAIIRIISMELEKGENLHDPILLSFLRKQRKRAYAYLKGVRL